ncbi:hypothetical protein [Streptomyces tubercidicus]|uniref:hypothetical protein n=1 Tax=Streptomyces tubercidicus TaxID=47759 RepID=UPI003466184D
MAKKDRTKDRTKDQTTDAAREKDREKDREKWMARLQVRLVTQPGVDRAVVLQAVKEVTAHCAETGEHPRDAFGDPDAYAVQTAARLAPADRAARERRHDSVVGTLGSVLKRAGEVTGL